MTAKKIGRFSELDRLFWAEYAFTFVATDLRKCAKEAGLSLSGFDFGALRQDIEASA